MLKMTQESEDPSSITAPPVPQDRKLGGASEESQTEKKAQSNGHKPENLISWFKNLVKLRNDTSLREAIEEYIEEPEHPEADSVSAQERALLLNILKLRDISVVNVMIPRADIIAIEENTTKEELLALLSEKQFSRLPVYRETLDEVLGTIHIKDILSSLAKDETIDIPALVTEIPIVSPAMSILDLMLEMREHKRHMVLVVDEYGGIDGLVTIGDVIESIIGEIDDEHDIDEDPQMKEQDDGSVIADARVSIEEFEQRFGKRLSSEEREESETLGGLVFLMAGRVPARGEVLAHTTGMVFKILDADPRRIKSLKIYKIPKS